MRFRWVAVAGAVGVALAVSAALVNHVPVLLGELGAARADRSAGAQAAEFASLLLDSGWAWAAAAVAAGWLVSDRARPFLVAAMAGGIALLAATLVYESLEGWLSSGGLSGQVRTFWVVGSVLLGPLLGLVGAAIRRPGPVGLLAALVVPAGAALNMVVVPPPEESLVARPVTWLVWAAAAGASVLVVRARRQQADS